MTAPVLSPPDRDHEAAFLAAAAHAIRTPLNAIGLLAELSRQTSDSAGETADDLQNSVMSLTHLINDVIEILQLDRGRIEIRPRPIAIEPLIASELDKLRPAAAKKGLELHRDGPMAGFMLGTDPDKLSRIIGALLANAVHFSERGHVSIDAQSGPSGGLRVTVGDSGPGVAADRAVAIFDEHLQLSRPAPQREQSHGSGLSLAIARRLARQLGGTLELANPGAAGASFVLTVADLSTP